jgi:hypothetical protein
MEHDRDEKLRKWVSDILKEMQEAKKYAQVTIHLQDGVILRVETKESRLPSKS